MTRGAFLFKLLAAVGIGQATLKDCSLKNPCLTGNAGNISTAPTWKCAALDGRVVECAPKDGEEYCPLGHPQKPQRINGTSSSLRLYAAEDEFGRRPGPTLGPVVPSVCSVCGIVYVTTNSTFSK